MNVIELVTKYLPVLDEQYRLGSKTAVLDVPKEFVRETKNAKKVLLARLQSQKLGGYSRANGFVKGSVDLDWEEHEFTQDRGRALQVDIMDDEESFNLAFGRLAGHFQREAVIPELDAYRIAVYSAKAGIKKTLNIGAGESVLELIDALDEQMDDLEVPEEGRMIFLRPSVYYAAINDAQIRKVLEVSDELTKALNKKIYSYNGHPLIKVPSTRMYSAIKLLDGTTVGEEDGGYEKAAGAFDVGMLMVHMSAICQITKRAIARIWAPSKDLAAGCDGVNPDADAWKFDFRVYHDAWVLDEKVNGIACVALDETEIAPGTYTDGAYHQGATFSINNGKVKGVIAQGAAVPEISLAAGNRFVIKLTYPGITAKSQLPTGNVVTTINSTTGYVNTKTRDVFEDDGSLIVVTNIEGVNTTYTVKVKWNKDLEYVYKFTFEDASFPSA